MVDSPNPWQAESDDLAAALKAAEQQAQPAPVVGGLTPPPVNPWQAERDAIAAGLKQPPASEAFGPPAPAAPYGPINAAVHGFTGGLIDPARAALIAGTHYLTGRTQDFNYPEAAAEVQRGRVAYESEHPYLNLGANLAGSITGPGGLGAKAITATPTWLGKLGVSTGIGALTGGVQGAAENTTSVDEMLRGARIGSEWGGGFGAAVPIASSITGAAFPKLSPEIRTLRAAGVQPTPGTIGGIPGVVEDVFSHLPFTGPPIRAGRAAAQGELQDALKNLPAGPARNATGQFVAGGAPFATARKDLLAAGDILPAASSGHSVLDRSLEGGMGLGAIYHLLEHGIPDWKTLAAAGTVYPGMKALYSSPGRWATTGLLGAWGEVSPAVAPYGPVAGQVAPGLLTGLYNRQTQP